MFVRQREIEMRPVEEENYLNPKRLPPYKNTWIRTEGKLPKDQIIQQAFLLYISLIWVYWQQLIILLELIF